MITELLFKEESYKIVSACFEVYREKGCGYEWRICNRRF
jgi:hypothetical protein